MRRQAAEIEEKNLTLEFYMSVINPEMYKEYLKQKDTTVHEVASYKEDMSEEEFMAMTAKAHQNYTPEMLAKAKKRADEMKSASPLPVSTAVNAPLPQVPSPAAEHPAFDVKNPATWQRPPGVPPMKVVPNVPPPDQPDDDDINPVSLKVWE